MPLVIIFRSLPGSDTEVLFRLVLSCACFCTLLLTASAALGQSTLLPRSEIQEWNDVQVAVPITKNIDFGFQGTLRFGRGLSRPVDERFGAGFAFRVGKYLTLSPNYQHIAMQPSQGRSLWEERLSLPVLVRFKLGHFTLGDRNTFERRLRHPGVNATRYRNRLQIDHPVGPDKMNLSAYASDEVFYDWSLNVWVRNRFAVGVTKVFNKHVSEDFYYMRQNDSHSFPGDLNILGTSLRFRL